MYFSNQNSGKTTTLTNNRKYTWSRAIIRACQPAGLQLNKPAVNSHDTRCRHFGTSQQSRFQWQRGLRRRPSAARLLRLWFRIPPGVWMFVCCECCVLSGRGLCDGLITRPEGFYRLWRVIKTIRKQVKINRSNRWATPEATIPLA